MSTHTAWQPRLVAYDDTYAREIIRSWSAQHLRDALRSGNFGISLSTDERTSLDELLTAWVDRALGYVFLRDALLVDGQRGPQVFGLICAALVNTQIIVSDELFTSLRSRSADNFTPANLVDLTLNNPDLLRISDLAGQQGLSLALLEHPTDYPYPHDLRELLPLAPLRLALNAEHFQPPTGIRRNIAMLLAISGIVLLIVPMLNGSIPEHPAGLPLALITLALMVGIKAGWSGYVGAICLWLVPNLPGFRYDRNISELLPYLPILVVGIAFLIADRRIRALWIWVRAQIGG